MADDHRKTPAPRPRRRRTDIDPTYQPPKVAHERRRSKATPPAESPVPEPTTAEASAGPSAEPSAGRSAAEEAAAGTTDVTAEGIAAEEAAAGATAAAGAEAIAAPGEMVESSGTAMEGIDAGVTAATAATAATEPAEANAPVQPEATPTEQTRLFSIPAAKVAHGAAASTDPDADSWLAMLDDRSSDPAICPFLRAVVGEGIGRPVEAPDAANRCAALREPVPQSLRQQELVCLTTAHVNCPRYLRGAVDVAEVPAPVVSSGRTRLTPAMFGAIVLLIGAFALSVGFVASRGGMEVASIASASPSAVAAASPTPVPSTAVVVPTGVASPSTAAAASATPSPTVAPTATPSASPSPTVAPTPTASATPVASATTATPRPTATSKPRSNRYALLTACAGTANCYIYRVRSGDNVYSIARYFGVPIAKVYAMNAWLDTTGLKAGQSLRLPTPTR